MREYIGLVPPSRGRRVTPGRGRTPGGDGRATQGSWARPARSPPASRSPWHRRTGRHVVPGRVSSRWLAGALSLGRLPITGCRRPVLLVAVLGPAHHASCQCGTPIGPSPALQAFGTETGIELACSSRTKGGAAWAPEQGTLTVTAARRSAARTLSADELLWVFGPGPGESVPGTRSSLEPVPAHDRRGSPPVDTQWPYVPGRVPRAGRSR